MSHRQVLRVSVFALAGVLAITPAARAAGDVPGTKATAKPAAEAAAAPGQLAVPFTAPLGAHVGGDDAGGGANDRVCETEQHRHT